MKPNNACQRQKSKRFYIFFEKFNKNDHPKIKDIISASKKIIVRFGSFFNKNEKVKYFEYRSVWKDSKYTFDKVEKMIRDCCPKGLTIDDIQDIYNDLEKNKYNS